MLIFNYFLFVSFIHLCNPFILINKQFSSNFISRDRRNKLNMGCDYYIDKNLHVYDYNDIEISYINIEHERGYYWFMLSIDEDDNWYDTEFNEYKKHILESSMKPIIIYTNNTFNKLYFEIKYKKIIESEIKIFNKTLNDVKTIIKIENRYER
jgi:hypothetical protein